jgi:hypothetical protein
MGEVFRLEVLGFLLDFELGGRLFFGGLYWGLLDVIELADVLCFFLFCWLFRWLF